MSASKTRTRAASQAEQLERLTEAAEAMAEAIREQNIAIERSRAEMAEMRAQMTETAVSNRDDALAKVMQDVDRLRGLIEDERTPAEQAQDEKLYANVLRAPGIRAATGNTFAARARVGRAAKKAGMRLDEWARWCSDHGWDDMTKAPSPRERAMAENKDQTLLFEDEPVAPKRPRGRPKGKKDSKPRKKKATKKKTTAKKKATKKAAKKVSKK